MDKILAKYMPLKEGEEILDSLEGDAYFIATDPFSRMLAFLIRIIAVLTGASKKVYVAVTASRVIVIEVNKTLWFLDGAAKSTSYAPRAIGSVGYELSRAMLFFKTHYLSFHASSGATALKVRAKAGQKPVMLLIGAITDLGEKVRT
jgi:hypothetical protein